MENYKNILENKGATLSVQTLEKVALNNGYMVSLEFGNANVNTIDNDEQVSKVAQKIIKRLRKKHIKIDGYIGIYQRKNGSWDFDYSVCVKSRFKALKLARKNNQEAIYDNARGVCQYVD